jgi:hypothetical protein
MKPTIPEVHPLVVNYYQKPENSVGGNLHIVLEDKNVKDSDVIFCLNQAIDKDDLDGEVLARQILSMSKTQRLKLAYMSKTITGVTMP